ncbi:hypothetical protein IP81_14815 [Novosphingobium sp. AAP83]|uniref:MoaF N-terminal domain-containing protein n=1 Tax=Novosphingobium sp. AAP83 TaxID=1523425 RepID=UPI0006B9DC0A|nr:MoaF N-terminal domain-containing protein [Novosphingobium sp. AAP83]KPF90620.1 hypothetical protein IP81_14815 [Novosphingobium sp. AAP83]
MVTGKPEINTVPNQIAPGSRPDEIGENSTQELDGHQFEYQYPTGRRYRIRFYDDRLSFQLLGESNNPVRALPYRAQKVRPGLYLVHWMIPGRTGHVALVIDIPRGKVHVGALMPGQQELFDEARIEKHVKY